MNASVEADSSDGPVVTLIEFTIDPTRMAEFDRLIREVAPGTRGYPGNRGFETYSEAGNPARIIHRVSWDSVRQQKQYMQWREGTGVFDRIRSFIVTGPVLTYWRCTNTC
jgi:quinol monooxygenase YgiN